MTRKSQSILMHYMLVVQLKLFLTAWAEAQFEVLPYLDFLLQLVEMLVQIC